MDKTRRPSRIRSEIDTGAARHVGVRHLGQQRPGGSPPGWVKAVLWGDRHTPANWGSVKDRSDRTRHVRPRPGLGRGACTLKARLISRGGCDCICVWLSWLTQMTHRAQKAERRKSGASMAFPAVAFLLASLAFGVMLLPRFRPCACRSISPI
jgi:hypothetical protein